MRSWALAKPTNLIDFQKFFKKQVMSLKGHKLTLRYNKRRLPLLPAPYCPLQSPLSMSSVLGQCVLRAAHTRVLGGEGEGGAESYGTQGNDALG